MVNEGITAFLISIGLVIMVLSAWNARQLLPIVIKTRYSRDWRWLFALIIFFGIGYFGAIALTIVGASGILILTVGVMFLFGSAFVFLAVRTSQFTIEEMLDNQDKISQARDEAIEANHFKNELLAKLSHELRTPLNAILGYAGMFQEDVYGSLTNQQHQLVDRIAVNAGRLIQDINRLLDQSQIESGHTAVKNAPFSTEELLHSIESVIQPLAEKKGLKLITEKDRMVPRTLIGDQKKLLDILSNLASNAVKFTRYGEVRIRFFIPEGVQAPTWAMQVIDTGPGIPLDDQEIIFEPFKQIDNPYTREHPGIGLGLSIVNQLTKQMGGDVELVSQPGRGSSFTILLPMRKEKEAVSNG